MLGQSNVTAESIGWKPDATVALPLSKLVRVLSSLRGLVEAGAKELARDCDATGEFCAAELSADDSKNPEIDAATIPALIKLVLIVMYPPFWFTTSSLGIMHDGKEPTRAAVRLSTHNDV